MSAYNVALFIHIVSVVMLFVAIALTQIGLARLRQTNGGEQARLWLRFIRPTQRMFPIAIALVFLSGAFMAGNRWSFTTPWIDVALAGLAFITVVGAIVPGRWFGALERAAATFEAGPAPEKFARVLGQPGPWAAIFSMSGVAVGVLWLMTNKPDWAASAGIVGGLALLGAVAGTLISRAARRKLSAQSAAGAA